jgi:hypothetical protein
MLIGAAIGAVMAGILLALNLTGVLPDATQAQFIAAAASPFLLVYAAAATDRRPKASLLQPMPLVVAMMAGVLVAQGFFPTTAGLVVGGLLGVALEVGFSALAPETDE